MSILNFALAILKKIGLYRFAYQTFIDIFYTPLRIKKKKIVFFTMNEAYGCNPKYICNEIIRRKLPYELVWITNRTHEEGDFPASVRLVPTGLRGNRERATAQIMICNARTRYFRQGYRKKKGQTYIQTWHGSYGIKKMEADCMDTLPPEWIKVSEADSENIDCLLSGGTWCTDIFKKAFFCKSDIIKETGLPRNDIFFSDTKNVAKKVRQYYQLAEDCKIALYAPTFRQGDLYTDKAPECYQIDYSTLHRELTAKFGGEWVIITRLHPLLKDLYNDLPSHVINGCHYPDMQELMCASNFMISDYSSCIYDFMLSRRPGFIFATDIEEYNTERGFYYPLEETPFPIAVNNEQLATNIRNFDLETYITQVDAFLRDKGSCDDGHAAERCVDYIEERMKEA